MHLFFAALGDETRLSLVAKALRGAALFDIQLAGGSKLTRQAITKHLRYSRAPELCAASVAAARCYSIRIRSRWKRFQTYLDLVSEQWDQALAQAEVVCRRLRARSLRDYLK